ncbi:hypothetical protein [Streptomyces sp. NPDC055243]|uniref:hypothetical protein n=1 Tax=Streptomyces sp. NPDC055243 TaxID=3365720 RepID=UPI0037D62FB4
MPKRLAELLDDPLLLARYRAATDGQVVGQMVPSLPYIDAAPVDGSLRSPTRPASPWRTSSGW